jgi:hypothetical protein
MGAGMKPVVAGIVLCMLGGCSAIERSTAQEEARQLAWTGPGAGPCAFGGVTPRAENHCALVMYGSLGMLEAVNDKVRRKLGPVIACQDHVREAKRELARHRGIKTESLYSCPPATRASGECHVSLLVTTPEKEQFVLDNGVVVSDAMGVDGVASYALFTRAVDGVTWRGRQPTVPQIRKAIPGFEPATVVASRWSFR